MLRAPGLPVPGMGPDLGPGSSAPRQHPSVWVLTLAFLLSAGVGLGLTVLIGSLLV
jgi:hypothetical protein